MREVFTLEPGGGSAFAGEEVFLRVSRLVTGRELGEKLAGGGSCEEKKATEAETKDRKKKFSGTFSRPHFVCH